LYQKCSIDEHKIFLSETYKSVFPTPNFLTVVYVFLSPQEVLHLLQKSPPEIRLSIYRPPQEEHRDIDTSLVTSYF